MFKNVKKTIRKGNGRNCFVSWLKEGFPNKK